MKMIRKREMENISENFLTEGGGNFLEKCGAPISHHLPLCTKLFFFVRHEIVNPTLSGACAARYSAQSPRGWVGIWLSSEQSTVLGSPIRFSATREARNLLAAWRLFHATLALGR